MALCGDGSIASMDLSLEYGMNEVPTQFFSQLYR